MGAGVRWRDPAGRKFASLALPGRRSVAPRVVRVAGFARRVAARPVAWRRMWVPNVRQRRHQDAGRAAVRHGLLLLRAWGFAKPELHRGALATESAVGRAFASSGWRHATRRRLGLAGQREIGRRTMVSMPVRAVRRVGRWMEGSVLSRGSIAPSGAAREDRRTPLRIAGIEPAASREYSASGAGGKGSESGAMSEPITKRGAFDERVGTPDLARWLGALFGDEARRPPSGVTGFDGRSAPIFPGRKPGF